MGPTGSWIIGSNPPYFAIRNSWTLAPASSLGRLEDHTEPLLTLLPTGAWPLAALAPATLQGVHIVLSAPSTRRSPKFAPLHAVCHRAPLSVCHTHCHHTSTHPPPLTPASAPPPPPQAELAPTLKGCHFLSRFGPGQCEHGNTKGLHHQGQLLLGNRFDATWHIPVAMCLVNPHMPGPNQLVTIVKLER